LPFPDIFPTYPSELAVKEPEIDAVPPTVIVCPIPGLTSALTVKFVPTARVVAEPVASVKVPELTVSVVVVVMPLVSVSMPV
jgi:hypothetical protein